VALSSDLLTGLCQVAKLALQARAAELSYCHEAMSPSNLRSGPPDQISGGPPVERTLVSRLGSTRSAAKINRRIIRSCSVFRREAAVGLDQLTVFRPKRTVLRAQLRHLDEQHAAQVQDRGEPPRNGSKEPGPCE
jgi:hypothetical protein